VEKEVIMRLPVENTQNLYNYRKAQLQSVVEEAKLVHTLESTKTIDPLDLFPSGVEFFLPIGSGDNITMFGFWVSSDGFLRITIQHAIVPDNIFSQIKVITLKLPSALLLSIFFFGFGMFSIKLNILGQRAASKEKTKQIQKILQKVMDTFNNLE
jgi:hypothetical protein